MEGVERSRFRRGEEGKRERGEEGKFLREFVGIGSFFGKFLMGGDQIRTRGKGKQLH